MRDRRCKRCKKVKAESSFSNDSSRVDGKFPWCKECQTSYAGETKFQDPTAELNGYFCPLDDTPIRGHKNRRFCSATCKERVGTLREKYGLTVEQYREMVDATGGKCPLCLNRIHLWNVDHAHKTGQVLGVVCTRCNVGALAMTYHDVEYTKRLLDFLENPPAAALGINVTVPEGTSKPSNLHKVWNKRSGYVKTDYGVVP